MRIGDTIENSIWLNGEETPEQRAKYETEVTQAINDLCEEMGFLHGPLRWLTLKPGDQRVPEVPDHIQGMDVKLLIAEADVLFRKPQVTSRSFVGDLEKKDLIRLRQITREAHQKHNPKKPPLTDAECDDVIEFIGLEAAFDAVKRAVDGGAVH